MQCPCGFEPPEDAKYCQEHKVFISYHHDDQEEVDDFISTFGDERSVFVYRAI